MIRCIGLRPNSKLSLQLLQEWMAAVLPDVSTCRQVRRLLHAGTDARGPGRRPQRHPADVQRHDRLSTTTAASFLLPIDDVITFLQHFFCPIGNHVEHPDMDLPTSPPPADHSGQLQFPPAGVQSGGADISQGPNAGSWVSID